MPPTHLIARSSDQHTICGLRTTDKAAHPYLLVRHLPMHQKGRGSFEVCPACLGTDSPLSLSRS